jgi:hypothetical protein
MSGVVDTVGGFLGTSDGPKVDVQSSNYGLGLQNRGLSTYDDPEIQKLMRDYGSGAISLSDLQNSLKSSGVSEDGAKLSETLNNLATGATTGSRFATDQVQNNAILGQLFGKEGLLGKEISKEQQLQNQGFQLTPDDQTMYGQMSGDIARQFGQQGNKTAADLASRGLSSSGAAGAAFSGLAGNQNEMLAKAQQQIAQQRFQNTLQQIGQQQNMINSLGGQAGNAINQQYGRQLEGANAQRGFISNAAQQQLMQNQSTNNANMAAANFAQENKPANFMDVALSGVSLGAGAAGQSAGKKGGDTLGTSLFKSNADKAGPAMAGA